MEQLERRLTRRLYAKWEAARRGAALPQLDDLEAGDDQELMDRSFVIDVTPGPSGYRFVRFGAELRRLAGIDFSGYSIASLPEKIAHDALDVCHTAIASSKPISRTEEFTRMFGRSICYRMIVLPIAKHRKRVDALVGTVGYRLRRDEELERAGGLAH